MKRIPLGALFALGLLLGCRHQSALTDGRLKDAWAQVSDKDYIRTRGIGVAPDSAHGQTRRRAAARSAALVAARYELLSVVKGVRVTGGLSVEDLISKDSRIKEVADRIIEGAEEVVTEWTEDDGCVVVLELKRSKVREILMRDESQKVPPLPDEVQRFWKSQEAKDRNDKMAIAHNALSEARAKRAAALGLLFPGLGQVAVAKHIRNPTEASSVRTRGWITMAMGVGWGTGAYLALTTKKKVRDEATGREKEQTSAPLGYAALGLVAYTQYWGVRDAYRTLDNDRLSVAILPAEDGAVVAFAKRF